MTKKIKFEALFVIGKVSKVTGRKGEGRARERE